MLPMNRIKDTGRRGFSLIEILVVLVIIIVLSTISYNVYLGHSKNAPPGKAHSPIERAHDTECIENIHNVRLSIETFHTGDTDARFPDSLFQLKELPPELRVCPEGKEPYQYDPATGQVHCVHPGHEKY